MYKYKIKKFTKEEIEDYKDGEIIQIIETNLGEPYIERTDYLGINHYKRKEIYVCLVKEEIK